MSLASRLLRVTLFLPLLAQAGVLDTHERETQKRREDGYRADAPNNPGSTPKVPQWFIDDMRQRTEPQGGQDISPATRAFMAEQEEMKRRAAEDAKERERKAAEQRAQVQMEQNERIVRVRRVLIDGFAGSNAPMKPAVYDRAMAVAWPDPNVMLQVARLAQKDHPELWRLRLGFLLSAGCDPEAQASREQYPHNRGLRDTSPEQYCDNTRYLRGHDVLKPLLASGSELERALVCGLLYNWEGHFVHEYPYYESPPQLAAKPEEMEKAIADCRASLPAETVFTQGLFEPLFLLGERDQRDLSQVLWWPLFLPATWEGVDLADAAAIRAVLDRVAAESLAPPPQSPGASAAPSDPLLGATPEQVRKALGRPDKKLQRLRVHIPYHRDRSNCLAWDERGPLNGYAYARKYKVSGGGPRYEVNWVVFNRDDKACAVFSTNMEARFWKEL